MPAVVVAVVVVVTVVTVAVAGAVVAAGSVMAENYYPSTMIFDCNYHLKVSSVMSLKGKSNIARSRLGLDPQ